ncbi:MAG: hypothetical protein EAY75_01460, partial [Bacteroidetes bacterium]
MKTHLTHLGLENFRVFKNKTDFDFAPITILTGTNSSGKSSLISAMEMLKKGLLREDKHEPNLIYDPQEEDETENSNTTIFDVVRPLGVNFNPLKHGDISTLLSREGTRKLKVFRVAKGYRTSANFQYEYTYALTKNMLPTLVLECIKVFNEDGDCIIHFAEKVQIKFSYFFKKFTETIKASKNAWDSFFLKSKDIPLYENPGIEVVTLAELACSLNLVFHKPNELPLRPSDIWARVKQLTTETPFFDIEQYRSNIEN